MYYNIVMGTLADNFIKLFEATGLSQSRFAKITGTHQTKVCAIVNGKEKPSARWISIIQEYFNVDISKDNMSLNGMKKYDVESKKIHREYRPDNPVARDNLEKLFKASGLSYNQFFKGLGISAQAGRQILVDGKSPTPYILNSIKEKTGIDLNVSCVEERHVNNKTTIKRLFFDLVEQTHLSLADFSRSLELSECYASKVRGSARVISQSVIDKIEEVYGVNLLTADKVVLSDDKKYKSEEEIREDFLKIYTKYLCRKKELKEIVGKTNYHHVFQIVNKNKPVPKCIIENIRKNLGISIDKYTEQLVGAGECSGDGTKYVFLLNNNTVPLVVYSEAEAKEKHKELTTSGINFSLFKEIVL